MNCLQTGGQVYFMKGPNVDPEIRHAKKIWREYYSLSKNISYQITPNSSRKKASRLYKNQT